MNSSTPRIAVIGAGVIGLSVARSLARLGAQVSILEQSRLGSGTSSTTFAWINSNGKQPDSYHALNCAGMAEHVALQDGGAGEARWLDVCGTYEWAIDAARQAQLDARATALKALGYAVEEVSRASLQQRIPELRIDARSGTIRYFAEEALVSPSILMARLWAEARSHGAVLRESVSVVDIAETPQGVTLDLSTGERWQGDYCVLATGRWTPELMPALGVSLAMLDANRPDKRACGFLASTDPQFVQLRANLIGPELNVRPDGGGRLLLQATDLDDRADPVHQAAVDGYVGREMLARLRRLFANTGHARIERLSVGQRSRPADGLPAVGFVTARQRAYVVATHSGMTLGPLLGRLVAEELVHQRRDGLLADYSPARLIDRDPRDFSPVASIHFPAEQ
ncbi:FAD-binding oxidoreductase [Burkholderia sp. A1]|uniref:NAD(P)/FAD-dependent oxidoreductase n=1 Tax=Burkholderia sp. A1 TaxID=148446 RepID=UPI000468A891|nr:FAD-binding oxidoreductase [Burkholderia sp. A1]